MQSELTTTNYKPELDGLRALALIFVVLEHSAVTTAFQGGFIGVDIFFVLSGYLITSLLAGEYATTGKIHLCRFYARRLLRLTPALFLLLGVYAAGLAAYYALTHKLAFLGTHLWALGAAATYTMNWNLALDIGPPGFLEHTWSLGIEEQFYLLWPLALLGAIRLLTRQQLALVCLALIVACNGWRAVLWAIDVPLHRIYMGLDTRIDGLLVGCLLALTPPARAFSKILAQYAFVPATALLGALAFMQWGSTVYRLGSGVIALSAAWVIVAVLTDHTSRLAGLLRLQPLTYLGKISYGCYLWHVPLFLALGWVMPTLPVTYAALAAALTFVTAAASYHWVETPIRAWGQRKWGKSPARQLQPITELV